ILRSFLRKGSIMLPEEGNTLEYLSVAYSVDTPLISTFLSIFGRTETEKLLNAINKPTQTTLRVNTLLTDKSTLLSKIPSSVATKNAPNGILVQGSVRELYGFEEGLFFIQDEASQICIEALGATPGELIMDICACPGSKSFGAAINMQNHGQVYSFDLHENKLSLVINSAKRLKIDIIKTSACDGRNFLPEFEQKADRIICDVPCSGFGVLAKKPEIRYKNPEESATLPKIQRDILENACRYLKPGGTLIYSTCTILPEENEKNIENFISQHPEFTLEPWCVGEITAENGMITLLPHIHNTDGFFIAKLKRKK
ncbi:MAG: 16S rRNA (cytosine(967)-C(5))-methyltransferase RsmB, partial [Ruminococcaceae bacterium]|nr:16S rRNA (cytosine(967)-C(5))-methyltransferase RsmB [Oscillospiraceae bacterium]